MNEEVYVVKNIIDIVMYKQVIHNCDNNVDTVPPYASTMYSHVKTFEDTGCVGGARVVYSLGCNLYSHVQSTQHDPLLEGRAAAKEAESRMRNKYASLTDRFDFQPIAVETSGVFGVSTLVFLRNLGSRIASAKGDVRERTWLIQRISLAIVRGNAISIPMSCRRFFLHQSNYYFCVSM